MRDIPEQPVKEADPIEVFDVLLCQIPEGIDIGNLEPHANQPCLSRSRRPVQIHDGPAWHQGSTVDAWLPENQMGAAHRTAFSAPVVQTRSEEVGRHRPRLAGGGSDKLIDFGKCLRDLFRRKAVAQPLTSADQVALQHI